MPMIGSSAPRVDTLRAYAPTPRDRLAMAFTRALGDTRFAADMSRRMIGSDGIGNTGMGVVDMIPGLGTALQLDEAGAAMTGGHPLAGAGAAALAAVPVAGPVLKAGARKAGGMIGKAGAKAIEALAPKAEEAVQGFTAYHGSPHTFDQFDASKIGTGEGAQAYGHGLYFAQNEDVAKGYRDSTRLNQNNAETRWDGRPYLHYEVSDELAKVARQAGGYDNDAATPYKIGREVMEAAMQGDDLDHMLKFVRQSDWAAQEKAGYASAILAAKERLNVNAPKGSMYQVRIKADPNDFIDWDKPFEQQSPKVQRILAQQGYEAKGPELAPHYRVMGYAANDLKKPSEAKALSEAGIPGIKYLDQGSRGAGEGSRNFVVFNPRIVDIMKRYGVTATVAAGIAAGTIQPPRQ